MDPMPDPHDLSAPATPPGGTDAGQVKRDAEQAGHQQGLRRERVADGGVGPVEDEGESEDYCGDDGEHQVLLSKGGCNSGAHLTAGVEPHTRATPIRKTNRYPIPSGMRRSAERALPQGQEMPRKKVRMSSASNAVSSIAGK